MTKPFLLLIVGILLATCTYAQNEASYYNQGQLVHMQQSYDTILINTSNIISNKLEAWLDAQKDVVVISRMPSLKGIQVYHKNRPFLKEEIDYLAQINDVLSVSLKVKGESRGEEMWARNALLILPLANIPTQNIIHYIKSRYAFIQIKNIPLGKDTLVYIDLDRNQDVFAISRELFETQMLVFAEPDFMFWGHSGYTPNDNFYTSQWHLNAISAEQAWDVSTGSSLVRIAILEGGGFDLSHSELASKFTNPFDAATGSNNPTPQNSWDNHATCVAGCIAAATNNSSDIASIGFNCKMVPVNIASSSTAAHFSTSSSIIADAASHVIGVSGVVAINNSYYLDVSLQTTQISYTNMKTNCRGGLGAVVLACTANDNELNPSHIYPASFPGVVGVGATDQYDQRCNFSNYGYNLVDVSAPGTAIYTTDRTGSDGYIADNYVYFEGTSAACPIAAGIVGLMASANSNLTAGQLEDYLEQSCDKVGSYNYFTAANHPNGTVCNEIGYGRVNACAAVNAVIGQSCGSISIEHDFYINNLVLSSASFAPNDALTIACEQWTSNPSGSAETVYMEYTLKNMNGSTIAILGTDNSIIGGGDDFDAENITTNLPLTLPNGTYQICATANTSGVIETTTSNNTQCQYITVSSGGSINAIQFSVLPMVAHVTCNSECDGAIYNIIVTGGTPPYSYLWNNGASSANIGNLCSGTYNLTITDANGLSYSPPVGITINSPTALTANSLPIYINATCHSACDGTISNIAFTGGTPPYYYLWNNGSTTTNLFGLCAGQYAITVTDANNCTYSPPVAIAISEPNPIDISLLATDATSSIGSNNGNIQVTINGGIVPYSYYWSNGSSSPNLDMVSSGTYTLTVTDANDCTEIGTTTIGPPLSTTNLNSSSYLNVYPNISNGQVSLDYQLSSTGNISIELLSPNGQIIMTQSNKIDNTNGHLGLNLEAYTNGLYLIRLITDKEILCKRIILSR